MELHCFSTALPSFFRDSLLCLICVPARGGLTILRSLSLLSCSPAIGFGSIISCDHPTTFHVVLYSFTGCWSLRGVFVPALSLFCFVTGVVGVRYLAFVCCWSGYILAFCCMGRLTCFNGPFVISCSFVRCFCCMGRLACFNSPFVICCSFVRCFFRYPLFLGGSI